MYRPWAFWRRVQYLSGMGVFLLSVSLLVYVVFFRAAPSCTDGRLNGDERGVDCGGVCRFVCTADVTQPLVVWSQSFRVTDGFYNAVAYVRNENKTYGARNIGYTFTLLDEAGAIILEKSGTTSLPPDSEYPIFEGRLPVGDRIPARTFLTLKPTAEWEVLDSRRDQFVVNTRNLFGADLKPRLDVSLTNTLLRDERDVEVVATIFNREGTALTASRTVVPRFAARETQNVVFTWPEPIATVVRSCLVPSDVMLAIDLSGSMNDDGGSPPEPITSVLRAAASFVDQLRDRDQVGVVTFATNASTSRTLVGDRVTVARGIEALTIDPREERGGTNVGDAIIRATEEFASVRHSVDARKVLIVFTDGRANTPRPDGEAYAAVAAQRAKDSGIEVITIGLGANLNVEFLQSIASSPEHHYLASDTGSLISIYRTIGTSLCEEGPAVIDVVPKVTGWWGS